MNGAIEECKRRWRT